MTKEPGTLEREILETVMEFKDDLAKERDVDESVIDDLWMRLSMLFREETR